MFIRVCLYLCHVFLLYTFIEEFHKNNGQNEYPECNVEFCCILLYSYVYIFVHSYRLHVCTTHTVHVMCVYMWSMYDVCEASCMYHVCSTGTVVHRYMYSRGGRQKKKGSREWLKDERWEGSIYTRYRYISGYRWYTCVHTEYTPTRVPHININFFKKNIIKFRVPINTVYDICMYFLNR